MEPSDHIPDEHFLYVRVHHQKVNWSSKSFEPNPSAFYNTPKTGDNLSSDWSELCTPESSRELIGRQFKHGKNEFKNPNDFFITSFLVQDLRNNVEQRIQHDPVFNDPEVEGFPNNIAHSIIIDDKRDKNDLETRMKLVELSEWVIPPKK